MADAIARLDAWLQTMRGPGGYGGPVTHWWQSRYQYTGPGLDWRYEGLLIGYRVLYEKTGDVRWRRRLQQAAQDLIGGQTEDGSYHASAFEMNPATLGTPHEAAATLGLLEALPWLDDGDAALQATRQNLANLMRQLWDPAGRGFDDRPGIHGRVPNKLATLALALVRYAQLSGSEPAYQGARMAIEDTIRYQVQRGTFAGAIHQYAPGNGPGDGRFFPYYNARCIPPLLEGAQVFGERRYRDAARGILDFLRQTMLPDGSWPQIVYASGERADWPRWIAGAADMLLAFRALGEPIPLSALRRLLAGQLRSGGFRTAHGFHSQIGQRPPHPLPDYRDVIPVVGWNDKVLRLLADLLIARGGIGETGGGSVRETVLVSSERATYTETPWHMCIQDTSGSSLYHWRKGSPWASGSRRVIAR